MVDTNGKIAAGTTTNGLTYKIPGCVRSIVTLSCVIMTSCVDELGIPPSWELVHMQMLKWEGLPALEMVM